MSFIVAFFVALFVPTGATIVAASLPTLSAPAAVAAPSDQEIAANPSRYSVWEVHAAIQRIKARGKAS